MRKTNFAGLTQLDPGESLATDNFSFQSENPDTIDRLLERGAVTHRHDAALALADPADAPTADTATAGGTIVAGATLNVGYTLRDADQGETRISPLAVVTTQPPLDVPDTAPTAVADYTAGTLSADTYYYAVSLTDGAGGETPLGPSIAVTRDPGPANGQVIVSGLAAIVAASGAAGWRLWRAVGGGDFFHIGDGATDTFTDDGIVCADCSLAPVDDNQNFTNSANTLTITVPLSAAGTDATEFSLYVSEDPAFGGPSLLGTYPIADAGADKTFTELVVEGKRPPDVSTALPGASKIDPDTELLNWHWKQPVADSTALPTAAQGSEEGDVRVTLNDGALHIFHTGAWGLVSGGGGGGGGASLVNPLGTAIEWTDGGTTVAKIVAQERLDQIGVVYHDYSQDADGHTADGFYDIASGALVPRADAAEDQMQVYTQVDPTGVVDVGRVERDVEFQLNATAYYHVGVGLAAGNGQGLFARIRRNDNSANPPDLQLVWRPNAADRQNNDSSNTVIDSTPLPAAFVQGDFVTLAMVKNRDNTLTATVFQGKAVIGELLNVPIPAGAVALFGVGNARPVLVADRWISGFADAWRTYSVSGTVYDYHREIRATLVSPTAGTGEKLLFTDEGFTQHDFTWAGYLRHSAYQAGWEGTAYCYRDYEGNLRFGGTARKTSGAAPVAGEVIAVLGDFPYGVSSADFAVPTGDADGRELGIVTADGYNQQLVWQVGRSTDPATKQPYVSLENVHYYIGG